MAPKPKNAFDAFASKKPAASKKASNKIAATDLTAEVKTAVDQVIAIKAKMKALKAEQEGHEITIIDHVFPQQEKHAREGNYSKSFTVKGDDGTVTYTTQDKFSVPKDEAVHEEIEKLLGKAFNDYFRMFRTVKFTEDAMQDAKLVNALVAVAQEHGYDVPDVFQITDELATVKGMDEKQFELPKAKLAALRTLIKQYKATIK